MEEGKMDDNLLKDETEISESNDQTGTSVVGQASGPAVRPKTSAKLRQRKMSLKRQDSQKKKTKQENSWRSTTTNISGPVIIGNCMGNQFNSGEKNKEPIRCAPSDSNLLTSVNNQQENNFNYGDNGDSQGAESVDNGDKPHVNTEQTVERKLTAMLPPFCGCYRVMNESEAIKMRCFGLKPTKINTSTYFIDSPTVEGCRTDSKQHLDMQSMLVREEDRLEKAALNYVRRRKATVDLLRNTASKLLQSYNKHEFWGLPWTYCMTMNWTQMGGVVIYLPVVIILCSCGFQLTLVQIVVVVVLVVIVCLILCFFGNMWENCLLTLHGSCSKPEEINFMKVIQQDKTACDELETALEVVNTVRKNMLEAAHKTGGILWVIKQIYGVHLEKNNLKELVNSGLLTYEEVDEAGQATVQMTSAFGKGTPKVGAAYTIVQVPLNMCNIIFNINNRLADIPNLEKLIQNVAERFDSPSKEDMLLFLSDIKKIT